MRGATICPSPYLSQYPNFNPRSSCEERPCFDVTVVLHDNHFNPRSSCEERRLYAAIFWVIHDFNPRSSCEERLRLTVSSSTITISIHAPHARSDLIPAPCLARFDISIHAPHARSDSRIASALASGIFQSTLLMRGATHLFILRVNLILFQSTLLMRGATGLAASKATDLSLFQSTLLMRGATRACSSRRASAHFNPRSSCEERLGAGVNSRRLCRISIHAPHARSDAPCIVSRGLTSPFQSTLLMRGATITSSSLN